jgi:plastocyanin
MMDGRWLRAGVMAVTGATVLAGCSIWGPEGGPGGSGLKGPPPATAEPVVDATVDPDGVQRVQIEAGDNLRFTPAAIRARPGVLELVFHNVGTVPHDVEIQVGGDATAPAGGGGAGLVDSGNPSTGNVNGGQSATVRVSLTGPGRYPFICTYHVSSGMRGTIQIV